MYAQQQQKQTEQQKHEKQQQLLQEEERRLHETEQQEQRERQERQKKEKLHTALAEEERVRQAHHEHEEQELLQKAERVRQEEETQMQKQQQKEWERQREEALKRQKLEQEHERRRQEREDAVRKQQEALQKEAARRREQAQAFERVQHHQQQLLDEEEACEEEAREDERRRERLDREKLLQQPNMPVSRHAHATAAPLSNASSAAAPISASFAELQGRHGPGGGGGGALRSAAPSAPPSAAAPMSLTFQELQGTQGGAAIGGAAPSQPPSVVWGAAPSSRASAPISVSMQELQHRQGPVAHPPPSGSSSAPHSHTHAPISVSFQELQSRQGRGSAGGGVQGSQPASNVSSREAPRSHAHAPISMSFQELQHRQGPTGGAQDGGQRGSSANEGAPHSHAHAPISVSMQELQTRHLAAPPLSPPPAPISGQSPKATPDTTADAQEVASSSPGITLHSQIAALMRDTSLTPQERQRKIQDLRAGKTLDACPTPPPHHHTAATSTSPTPSPSPGGDIAREGSAGGYHHEEARAVVRERTAFQPESSGIEAGTRLVLPSELKKGVVARKVRKDWGECMLTFDSIKEAVKAADGHIYERWAIAKWLSENGNRSPLTNQVIASTLVVLTDQDEGQGARHVEAPSPVQARGGVGGGAVDGGVAEGVTTGHSVVGKLVVNEHLSEAERQTRAADKRASYMQSQRTSQREVEEEVAARLELERMEKLKRRGFAGYSPPTHNSGASGGTSARSTNDSGAESDAGSPNKSAPEAPETSVFDFAQMRTIHPENLLGIADADVVGSIAVGGEGIRKMGAGKSPALAALLAGGRKGGGGLSENIAQSHVAERAAALVQKKEAEVLRAEMYRKDKEAWGDKMPPPNKVVEAAFLHVRLCSVLQCVAVCCRVL